MTAVASAAQSVGARRRMFWDEGAGIGYRLLGWPGREELGLEQTTLGCFNQSALGRVITGKIFIRLKRLD